MSNRFQRPFASFEHDVLPHVLAPVLALLLLLAASRTGAMAEPKNVFVIPDSDGYGITDCLSGGKSCGRVVADAWCEAHGLGPAKSFGPANDVTGSVKTELAATQVPADATIVACAD